MPLIQLIADVFLHLDTHLSDVISQYGPLTYALLFGVIFVETGLVVMPFLPGDSLIFAAGAFAASGSLRVELVWLLLTVAAILGDTVNYWIGHYLGQRAYTIRWIKPEHLERTHAFFEKYGGKTILLARFVPILRTFAPFVAGVGRMSYGYFISYNVFGGILWVSLFTAAGYLFGNISFIREHFSLVVLGIVLVSLVPMVLEAARARRVSPPSESQLPRTP
jgi:membrane-associated protein